MAEDNSTNEIYYYRDRELVLYKRERSGRWQARFKLADGKWHRISTFEYDLKKAAAKAGEKYDLARFREKENRPAVSKRFASIAKLAIAEMEQQLENNVGRASFVDYISVIKNHLIPHFGQKHIDNISQKEYGDYPKFLETKMGRALSRSTLTTHNSALNRIFDIAITNAWLGKSQVPVLKNKGAPSERRPAFTYEEYMLMTKKLAVWSKGGQAKRTQMIRRLLRDYVLILANTGMRPGTESDNLKWKHIEWHKDKEGHRYLRLHVDGKTGARQLIARHNCEEYFKRIQSRFEDLSTISFDDLIKARKDEYVFRLENGERTKLNQNFEQFLLENNLLEDPITGQSRTLYSLRHTYATFALLREGFSIYDLAMQMGTSVPMIEKHYSHLTPSMKAKTIAGPKYS